MFEMEYIAFTNASTADLMDFYGVTAEELAGEEEK